MTIREMENISNKFLQENFNMELEIPIKINGRLKSTLGRFECTISRLDGEKTAVGIEIAKVLIESGNKENIVDVLKHELIHYALFKKGLPFQDRSATFQKTCNSMGVSLTGQIEVKMERHIYVCDDGHIIRRVKRFDTNLYRCSCGSELHYAGKKFV